MSPARPTARRCNEAQKASGGKACQFRKTLTAEPGTAWRPERRVGARLSRAQDAFDCVAIPRHSWSADGQRNCISIHRRQGRELTVLPRRARSQCQRGSACRWRWRWLATLTWLAHRTLQKWRRPLREVSMKTVLHPARLQARRRGRPVVDRMRQPGCGEGFDPGSQSGVDGCVVKVERQARAVADQSGAAVRGHEQFVGTESLSRSGSRLRRFRASVVPRDAVSIPGRWLPSAHGHRGRAGPARERALRAQGG